MFQEMMPMSQPSGGDGGADMGFIPWADLSGQSQYKVTLGYKPARITWFGSNASDHTGYFYDEDTSTTKFYGDQAGTSAGNAGQTIGSSNYCFALKSVDDDGFTLYLVDYQTFAGDGIIYFASKD